MKHVRLKKFPKISWEFSFSRLAWTEQPGMPETKDIGLDA
jgi:hypothetical protein